MNKNFKIAAVTLLVMLLAAVVGAQPILSPPPVVSAEAPATEFSAVRASRHLSAIAQEPRPVGSAAHLAARNYLVDALLAKGLDVQLQHSNSISRFHGNRAAAVSNILARIPGDNSTGAVLLMSHYDSVPHSPGVNDAGNGVAAILETVRAIQARDKPLDNDIYILLTDAEEVGLLGAQAFVDEHPAFNEVAVALNFEGRGDRGTVGMFRTVGPGNQALIETLAGVVPQAIAGSFSTALLDLMPNDTDLSVLRLAHARGMDFANGQGVEHYHTTMDNLDTADPRTLQHHGEYLLPLALSFGEQNLAALPDQEVVYFQFPGLGLVHYPEAISAPLATFSLLLLVLVLAFGVQQGELRLYRMLGGMVLYIGTILLLAGAGFGVWLLIRQFLPEPAWYGHFAVANGGLYLLGIATLVGAGLSSLLVAGQRYVSLREMAAAALLCWALVGFYTAMLLPGLAYLLTWPVLAATAGLWILLRQADERIKKGRQALLTLLGLPALVLWVPVIVYLHKLLTIQAGFVLLLLVLLMVGLVLIPLRQVLQTLGHRFSVLLATVGLLVLAGAIHQGGFSAERPKPNQVNYLVNWGDQNNWWVSGDPRSDAFTSQYLGVEPDTYTLAELNSWPRQHSRLSASGKRQALARPAPQYTGTVTEIERLDVRKTRQGYFYDLQVQPAAGAYATELVYQGAGQFSDLSVQGQRFRGTRHRIGRGRDEHLLTLYGTPPEGYRVQLHYEGDQPPQLLVVTHIPGLPDFAGAPENRGPEMMRTNRSDYTILQQPFGLPLGQAR